MSQRSLGSVLLKVLGVVCILKAVEFAATSLMLVFACGVGRGHFSETVRGLLPAVTPLVFSLLLAFILLRYADDISAKMFSEDVQAIPEGAHPKDDWYVLAVTVLGISLLIWFVPIKIAQCLSNFFWPVGDTEALFRTDMRPYAWRALLETVMQLGLGLYLVLGARAIVTFVRKLRRD